MVGVNGRVLQIPSLLVKLLRFRSLDPFLLISADSIAIRTIGMSSSTMSMPSSTMASMTMASMTMTGMNMPSSTSDSSMSMGGMSMGGGSSCKISVSLFSPCLDIERRAPY